MENKDEHFQVYALEVEHGDIDGIKDNLGLLKFSFLTVPRQGEQVILHTGELGPKTLYHVVAVRHEGSGPDATRYSQPRVTLYLSAIRRMREGV